MADSGFATSVTLEQLRALLTNQPPPQEGVAAAAGAGNAASRDDHIHPRLSSATIATLGGAGEVTLAFSRVFTAMPVLACLPIEAADNQPVLFKVKTWTQDAQNNYTGCTIKGYRSSILPALSGIILIGPLISALANYNVFGGSAAGVQFCCLAIQPSA